MWKAGPLPPDTWNWGGIVLKDTPQYCFVFADFCGDHVKLVPSGDRVEANEVVKYDNSIELPGWPKGESGTQPTASRVDG